MGGPFLGVIADDFTGATDIGAMLVQGGLSVVQTIGPPDAGFDYGGADAVVVALKTRSIPASEAVAQSLDALRALQRAGVEQVQFKYCSTFDSTPDGNIGPVSDALATALDCATVVHIPALPVNGRTVYQGHLFVWDQLLNESGMETHPLNPMTDANLLRWLRPQVAGDVGLIDHGALAKGTAHIRAALAATDAAHIIGDAVNEDDLAIWADVLQSATFLAGGSGLAKPLAQRLAAKHGAIKGQPADFGVGGVGHTLILAGSCSKATLAQIAAFRNAGGTCRQIDPITLDAGAETVAEIANWAATALEEGPVLIHGSASPEDVQRAQASLGEARASALIEGTLSDLAALLVPEPQVGRIVVAGGETSGAVVSRLEVAALRIGAEIDPGVPWTLALDATGAALIPFALKSGNFGAEDFFLRTSEGGIG